MPFNLSLLKHLFLFQWFSSLLQTRYELSSVVILVSFKEILSSPINLIVDSTIFDQSPRIRLIRQSDFEPLPTKANSNPTQTSSSAVPIQEANHNPKPRENATEPKSPQTQQNGDVARSMTKRLGRNADAPPADVVPAPAPAVPDTPLADVAPVPAAAVPAPTGAAPAPAPAATGVVPAAPTGVAPAPAPAATGAVPAPQPSTGGKKKLPACTTPRKPGKWKQPFSKTKPIRKCNRKENERQAKAQAKANGKKK